MIKLSFGIFALGLLSMLVGYCTKAKTDPNNSALINGYTRESRPATQGNKSPKENAFEELKFFYGLAPNINFTDPSLESALKLINEDLSPEESLIAADLVYKIRDAAEISELEPNLLVANRKVTIAVLEHFLEKADKSKLNHPGISLHDCRIFLAKLYKEEADLPDNPDRSAMMRKSQLWERKAEMDPRYIFKKEGEKFRDLL